MGYPMTYNRVVSRNHLQGDYHDKGATVYAGSIAGDLRRLETDSRDELHLRKYSELANITPEQVKIVLDAFFDCPWDASRVWPKESGLVSPIQLIDKLQTENRELKDENQRLKAEN